MYLNYVFAVLLEGKKNILIFEQNSKILIVVFAVSSCAHCTRCILFSPNLDNGTFGTRSGQGRLTKDWDNPMTYRILD